MKTCRARAGLSLLALFMLSTSACIGLAAGTSSDPTIVGIELDGQPAQPGARLVVERGEDPRRIALRGSGLARHAFAHLVDRTGRSADALVRLDVDPDGTERERTLFLAAGLRCPPGEYSLQLGVAGYGTGSTPGAARGLLVLTVPIVVVVVDGPGTPVVDGPRGRRPKLIVLIHGATPPAALVDLVPELLQQAAHFHLQPTLGTSLYLPGSQKFSRDHWGFPSVAAFLGRDRTSTIYDLEGNAFDRNDWIGSAPRNPTAEERVFLPSPWEPVIAPRWPGSRPQAAPLPPRMLLLTSRDGSLGVVTQARTLIAEIHDCYTRLFEYVPRNLQPDIIVVAHSMGGLAARAMLADPATPISEGWSGTPTRVSDPGDARAAFIRARVLYLVTMSSPHDGSPIAAGLANGDFLNGTAADAALDWAAAIRAMATGIPFPGTRAAAASLLAALRDRTGVFAQVQFDAAHDLTPAFWQGLNADLLRWDRSTRPNGSRIPVYALGGRSPGGGFFNEPFSRRGFPLHPDDMQEAEQRGIPRGFAHACGWAFVLLDQLVFSASRNPSGIVPGIVPSWGATSDVRLDKVRRVTRDNLGQDLVDASLPGDDVLKLMPVDQIVGWVRRQMSAHVPPRSTPLYLDHEVKLVIRLTPPQAEVKLEGSPFDLRSYHAEFESGSVDLSIRRDPATFLTMRDGECDADGLVSIASAWGMSWGSTCEAAQGGSWYRLDAVDHPWNLDHHFGVQRNELNARWIHDHLVSQPVGPTPSSTGFSTY